MAEGLKRPTSSRDGRGRDARQREAMGVLMRWYDKSARELPWRVPPGGQKRGEAADPWRVLVSELMLQQTTVATVNNRFPEFIARFPDPAAMAGATEEQVFDAWSGLGYYRRARRLREAAAILAARPGPPTTSAEWRKLPGVGDYTAAAVASICFGERIAAVDTNLVRVLARWGGLSETVGSSALNRAASELGRGLLHPDRPGDTNQALMDVGALFCTKRGAPDCLACPLAATCDAFATGRQTELPVVAPKSARAAKQKLHRRDVAVAVIRGDGASRELLLWRRAEASVYRGMWELPTWREGETDADRPPAAPAVDAVLDWWRAEAIDAGLGDFLSARAGLLDGVRHQITIYKVRLDLLPLTSAADDPPTAVPDGTELRWVPLADAASVVQASPQKRLLAKLAPTLADLPSPFGAA